MSELSKTYDPKQVEPRISKLWEEGDYFHAEPDDRPPEERFCVVIPPPNVTGALHLGHALNGTLQDILVRWHRMMGHNTLWMPGTDHAGIATQAVVERRIFEEEGRTRHDIGREELVKRIWQWKDEYETRIISQLKLMGCSCDFARKRFTLDEGCSRAVRETFFKLFKDGYIVRGKRLVNWDCELQTAVADDEVYHETIKGKFYHFRYPIKDAQQTGLDPPYVVIATTRPETMLGDTAVAVNPNDERYKHLVGKTIMLPLMNREIPIIADEWADPELGSGCVKITPAHDPNDYEVWQRHPEIGCINILNPDGTINENGNSADGKHKYAGMDRFEARKAVLRDLEALEMVDKIEDHKHDVGHSDRSKSQIEPYLSDQWFLSMGDLDNANDKEPQASACAIPQSGDEAVQPDDKEPQALACATVEWDSDAWLLTWTTYGSWLPGDEKGFVSRRPKENGSQTISNLPETPYDTDFPEVQTGATKKMGGERVDLTADQAQVAFQCIADVCERHRINPLAIAVMSDHVHILCQAEQDGSALLQLFKGNTSKVLSERWKLISAPRWWTKSGSKRHLRRGDDFTAAIEYVGAQANPLLVWTAGSGIQGGRSHRHADIAQAEASGSLATRGLASMALEAVENGSVRFFPERYKKTYIDWLSEKRDWCISRQLWWGHRIPAWINIVAPNVQTGGDYRVPSEQRQFIDERRNWILENVSTPHCGRPYVMPDPLGREGFDSYHNVVCFNGEPTDDERRMLRGWGYSESADVLDTWFSSALWPHSTLGWPGGATEGQGAASFSLRDCSRTDDAASNGNIAQAEACGSLSTPLLDYYYPTSVLITSRDIITLWVVRMVLTGLYNVGQKPFHEVYIHPKILDGRGVTMSKSKGNGVDPLDIIEVFGADALRFGIAAMTTETQDIRTPVEYRCPHCQKLTPQTPKNMFERGSTPTKVLACKHCNKEFATRWADETVQQEKGLALMVSDKFEAARNFTNKLWNAARFAFMNLAPEQREDKEPQASACAIAEPPTMLDLQSLSTEDRWILAELSEVIRRTHDALRHYQFSRATIGLRDFFWNCLCDWYLEMVKYRIAENQDAPAARQILAFCMDQILRLLHPIVPFITERLWQTLNEVAPQRGLPGVDGIGIVFPGSSAQRTAEGEMNEALTIARYPPTNGYPALDDTEVCAVFHDLQSATRAVREVRNVAGVAPKAGVTVTIKTTPERAALLQAESHILKRMARIDDLTIDPAATRPDKSAITIVGALQIFVHGLIDDDRQERQRIDKATAQLDKRIKGMESKLANESYVRSAPPEVVEETRDMLAGLNAERRTVQEILELLG